MMRKMFAPAFAVSLLALSTPVLAQSRDSSDTITINYSGIDMRSPSGMEQLERRIDFALNNLCGTPALGTLDEAKALRTCRDDARNTVAGDMKRLAAMSAVTVAAR